MFDDSTSRLQRFDFMLGFLKLLPCSFTFDLSSTFHLSCLSRVSFNYYFCDSRNFIEISRCLLFFSTILRTILNNSDICSAVTVGVRIKFLKLPTTFQFSCDGTSEW